MCGSDDDNKAEGTEMCKRNKFVQNKHRVWIFSVHRSPSNVCVIDEWALELANLLSFDSIVVAIVVPNNAIKMCNDCGKHLFVLITANGIITSQTRKAS